MGKQSNRKKSDQLGMNHSTAANRLRKMIMFELVRQVGLNRCYRCKEIIENVEDLSVEHKVPWLDSVDPRKLYFDLSNITFSHLSCNSKSSRGKIIIADRLAKEYPSIEGPDGTIYPSGKNLSAFCREHNLKKGRMYEIIHGTSRRKSHHGFKLVI